MRDVARALLIAASLLVLILPSRFGSTAASYAIATVVMAAVNAALVLTFRRSTASVTALQPRVRAAASVIAAIIGSLLLAWTTRAWLHQILIYPHDAWRADMLVVIQEGIRRLLRGDNPYTMYHVPWQVTLPYGPVMWLPYAVPYVLKADVRFVSLIGSLFVPVACAIAAVALAGAGNAIGSAASLLMLWAAGASPDLRDFASIAHTPSYWPGLALLAWLAARERWYAAAIAGGLLIVARTTLVACAPVLLFAIWFRDRRRAPIAALLLVGAIVLPYLPFALRDPHALVYALYGSYQLLMKGFVWKATTWAHNTIGVTGLLLRAGLQPAAELVQAIVMVVVYVFAWRSIRGGAAPLPWMALALFAFSATTLWPVHYLYFDVTMIWMAAALAESGWLPTQRLSPVWGVTLVASTLVVTVVAFAEIPRDPSIDVGIGATRPLLYRGFSTDEGTERTFAWIEGTTAEILVPRRSRAAADIELLCQPHLPTPATTQSVSVALNGMLLDSVSLRAGWHAVSIRAPANAWRIGVNELTLAFSTALSPQETGTGEDPRKLAAAIDRLTVRTRP